MENINTNIIMQAGAAVANAANKAAGISAATPEPGSIISVIQLVNGGRTIGPDSLAHFTESVRNKLLSLLVTMEPIQDLHGYDHPWPAGGGANMLDYSTVSVSETSVSFSDGIYLAANQAYTFSYYGPDNVTIIAYVHGTSTRLFITGYLKTYTFTPTEDVAVDITYYNSTGITSAENLFQVEKGSISHDWSPYSNICPISGRTGLNVYAGPTSAIGDATTYSMNWTSPAGTVYAGSGDIVSGNIKAAPYYASYNGETLVGPWVSSMDVYDPEGTPTTGAQVVDLGGTMTEYHITGQDIITLVGDNYIWSDSGDVTITE